MDVQKINNNAVQQIIDTFTQRLLEGEIGPGDQIPTEVELAERFGVARNTVREAIKILVAMGVLEIRRPVGTFVCSGFSEPMISPLLYGVILGRGDRPLDVPPSGAVPGNGVPHNAYAREKI